MGGAFVSGGGSLGRGPGVSEFLDQPEKLYPFGVVKCGERCGGLVALSVPYAMYELFPSASQPHPRAPGVRRIGFAFSMPERHCLLNEAGGAGLVDANVLSEFAD